MYRDLRTTLTASESTVVEAELSHQVDRATQALLDLRVHCGTLAASTDWIDAQLRIVHELGRAREVFRTHLVDATMFATAQADLALSLLPAFEEAMSRSVAAGRVVDGQVVDPDATTDRDEGGEAAGHGSDAGVTDGAGEEVTAPDPTGPVPPSALTFRYSDDGTASRRGAHRSDDRPVAGGPAGDGPTGVGPTGVGPTGVDTADDVLAFRWATDPARPAVTADSADSVDAADTADLAEATDPAEATGAHHVADDRAVGADTRDGDDAAPEPPVLDATGDEAAAHRRTPDHDPIPGSEWFEVGSGDAHRNGADHNGADRNGADRNGADRNGSDHNGIGRPLGTEPVVDYHALVDVDDGPMHDLLLPGTPPSSSPESGGDDASEVVRDTGLPPETADEPPHDLVLPGILIAPPAHLDPPVHLDKPGAPGHESDDVVDDPGGDPIGPQYPAWADDWPVSDWKSFGWDRSDDAPVGDADPDRDAAPPVAADTHRPDSSPMPSSPASATTDPSGHPPFARIPVTQVSPPPRNPEFRTPSDFRDRGDVGVPGDGGDTGAGYVVGAEPPVVFTAVEHSFADAEQVRPPSAPERAPAPETAPQPVPTHAAPPAAPAPDLSMFTTPRPTVSGAPVLPVVVGSDDLAAGDVSTTAGILGTLVHSPRFARMQQGVVDLRLEVHEGDPAAVAHVRRFVQRLDEEFPYWLFFANLGTPGLATVARCLLPSTAPTDDPEFAAGLAGLLRDRWVPALDDVAGFSEAGDAQRRSIADDAAAYFETAFGFRPAI